MIESKPDTHCSEDIAMLPARVRTTPTSSGGTPAVDGAGEDLYGEISPIDASRVEPIEFGGKVDVVLEEVAVLIDAALLVGEALLSDAPPVRAAVEPDGFDFFTKSSANSGSSSSEAVTSRFFSSSGDSPTPDDCRSAVVVATSLTLDSSWSFPCPGFRGWMGFPNAAVIGYTSICS